MHHEIEGCKMRPRGARRADGECGAAMKYRHTRLWLCASLTLADHMGDVSDDVYYVLKQLEMPPEVLNSEGKDLGKELGKLGITTLYATELTGEVLTPYSLIRFYPTCSSATLSSWTRCAKASQVGHFI